MLCGRTAARFRGLPLIDDDDPATGSLDKRHHDVAVWHALDDLQGEHVLHRHQLDLARCELITRGGVYQTSLPRTLFDLRLLVSREALVCALDSALHDRACTVADLTPYTARSHRFAAAVELADGRAESPAETLARLLLTPHLPRLQPQVQLREGSRTLARFDLGDEELKLAVETDGKKGHAGEVMRAKDTERDRTSSGKGWHTERVT